MLQAPAIDPAYNGLAALPSSRRFRWSRLDVGQIGRITAIISLIDRLPDGLLTLDAPRYADFLTNLEILRVKAQVAVVRGAGYNFNGEPVWRLRHALNDCPDEVTAADTHELEFIREPDLRADLRLDISEAYASLIATRWKAATVLAGAAVEMLLVWTLSQLPDNARQTVVDRTPWAHANERPEGPSTSGSCFS